MARCECGNPATYRQPKTGRRKADKQHHLCQACYDKQIRSRRREDPRKEFVASQPEADIPPEWLAPNPVVNVGEIRQFVELFLPLRGKRGALTRGAIQMAYFLAIKDVSPAAGELTDMTLRTLNKLFDLFEEYDGHVEAIVEAFILWAKDPALQPSPEKKEEWKPLMRKLAPYYRRAKERAAK